MQGSEALSGLGGEFSAQSSLHLFPHLPPKGWRNRLCADLAEQSPHGVARIEECHPLTATVQQGTRSLDPGGHTQQAERSSGQRRRHVSDDSAPEPDMFLGVGRTYLGPGEIPYVHVGHQAAKQEAGPLIEDAEVRSCRIH
jgi:hypothetical protein